MRWLLWLLLVTPAAFAQTTPGSSNAPETLTNKTIVDSNNTLTFNQFVATLAGGTWGSGALFGTVAPINANTSYTGADSNASSAFGIHLTMTDTGTTYTGGGAMYGVFSNLILNSSSLTGGRDGALFGLNINAATGNVSPHDYVALLTQCNMKATDATTGSDCFGINPVANLQAVVTMRNLVGGETDVVETAGATIAGYRAGSTSVDVSASNADIQGALGDFGTLLSYANFNANAAGSTHGFKIGHSDGWHNSYFPVSSTGTMFYAENNGTATTTGDYTVANVFDYHHGIVTGYEVNMGCVSSPCAALGNFTVDGLGNLRALSINGLLGTNTFACTNAFAADNAALTAAAAAGGLIIPVGTCQLSEAITLISHTHLNLSWATITQAANTNWSGSAITYDFVAASNAVDITVEGGNFTCDASSTGATHVLQFPSGNSQIRVLNNVLTGNNACGDFEAMVGVTDGKVWGNTVSGITNACYDNWNGTQEVEIADNYCSTANTGTSAIYGILWTGFNTNNSAGTATTHAKIHDNHILIANQATLGDIGIWLEGYATCSGSAAADDVDVHDNEIVFATGIWGQGIRASGCANNDSIHHNKIISDGTASTLPAIESKAVGVDIYIDNNDAYNWNGPTSGSDLGVFNNESTNGTLLFDRCNGASCTVPNYGGMVSSTQVGGVGTLPYDIAIWGVPVVIPSSGSMGNNGALTITTTLPTTFSKVYLYMPAGAISSGSAAGVYYATCSSATACTVFNNVLTSGVPQIVASPTSFVTTGPGAYTQTTSSMLTLVTIPILGGTMGADGQLDISTMAQRINNGDTVEEEWTLGGTEIALGNTVSVNVYPMCRTLGNLAGANVQVLTSASASTACDTSFTGNGFSYLSINTANTQNLVVEAQLNTATDWIALQRGRITAHYAP